jgi:hypothetical protein
MEPQSMTPTEPVRPRHRSKLLPDLHLRPAVRLHPHFQFEIAEETFC